ncbi:hypothetical protein ACTXT7_015655 [Hymenolepis weldensis]
MRYDKVTDRFFVLRKLMSDSQLRQKWSQSGSTHTETERTYESVYASTTFKIRFAKHMLGVPGTEHYIRFYLRKKISIFCPLFSILSTGKTFQFTSKLRILPEAFFGTTFEAISAGLPKSPHVFHEIRIPNCSWMDNIIDPNLRNYSIAFTIIWNIRDRFGKYHHTFQTKSENPQMVWVKFKFINIQ